jgi:hypothetical protein
MYIYKTTIVHASTLQVSLDPGQVMAQESAYASAVGLTSEQMRAWPRMGIKQHLACWPPSAQVEMKVLMVVGVMEAN